jgi:hypothetical protein
MAIESIPKEESGEEIIGSIHATKVGKKEASAVSLTECPVQEAVVVAEVVSKEILSFKSDDADNPINWPIVSVFSASPSSAVD